MGSICSTNTSPTLIGSKSENDIIESLSEFHNLYMHYYHVPKNITYLCGCLVTSGFRKVMFVVSDTIDVIYAHSVDLKKLKQLKDMVDERDLLSWDKFFLEITQAFQTKSLDLDFLDDEEDGEYCRLTIRFKGGNSGQKLNLPINLPQFGAKQSVKSKIGISEYFLIPLYEHYGVRTETHPNQKIEELEKRLKHQKSELVYLEKQKHLNTRYSKYKESESIAQVLKYGQTQDKKNDPMSSSQAQVSKFLITLKRRLVQQKLINETENEALTAVINNLNQDTIYRYELNKSQNRKVDLEVMAWLKNKFENEQSAVRQEKRDLSTVDAQSFIQNIDISQIDKTKTRQDIIEMFEKVNDWNFDVFKLRELTDGQTLFVTGYTLFVKYDLLRKFSIPENTLINFLREVQGGYHTNPYHNAMHAADVTQVLHFIIAKGGLGEFLSDLDIFGALIAALIHDYDHPGLNNTFQINTESYLATLYNDRAILENHHCASAFELMKSKEFNILNNISREDFAEIRPTIIEMVLATDINEHSVIVGKFRNMIETEKDFSNKSEIRCALNIAIKIADTSNPCRPRTLYLKWAKRIAEEFYNQGDQERELDLNISPFMDRTKPNLPSLQQTFITYLVIPMVDSYCIFLPKLDFCRDYVRKNSQFWDVITKKAGSVEAAEKQVMEKADFESFEEI